MHVVLPNREVHNSGSSDPPTSLRQGTSEWKLRPAAKPVLIRGGVLQGNATQQLRAKAEAHVREMVLPKGYPNSVSPGYAGYAGWLATGLFAHSFMVMVSTNALLSGFFAEMSAASWLMKDLLPPLVAGTLATRIRTLEQNPKKWLGAACFANSLLGCAEFLIPHLLPQGSWMALAICTGTCKMTGYLVIGASRAVLQKALATGDNLGEITTKLGTIGMVMHCFGSAAALTVIQFLDFWGQLGAISAGAAVGFYAPVRASQSVVMPAVTSISLRRVTERWATVRDDPASPWVCPSPNELHDQLAARWNVAYSLKSRMSAVKELAASDSTVMPVGERGISLHVSPKLSSAADVSALDHWRHELRAAGVEPPSTWTLGAGGDGRLLLLYSSTATAADVIEGFGAAWLAAQAAEDALHGERGEAMAGFATASVASLPVWSHEAALLSKSMKEAGWHCTEFDDVTRRVEWDGELIE